MSYDQLMERRLAIAALALATLAVWWFYARHLGPIWDAIAIEAILAGGACGVYASRRRWWLPLLPLPLFATTGYALSFTFSPTRPFANDNGGWAAAGVVLVAGIWFGLIATAAALVLLAIRAAAYSVEYFG